MALPKLSSFFKRAAKPAAPAKAVRPSPAADPLADDNGPVQQARQRARRRLIGAVVLLAIGVIGFPLLFETQPRPLPADLPLEIAQRDGGLVRQVPAQAAPSPAAEATPSAAATPAPAAPMEAAPASVPGATPLPPSTTPSGAVVEPPRPEPARTEPAQAAPAVPKPEPRPEAKPDTRAAEAERARALLEGRSAAPPAPGAATAGSEQAAGRFVVQVGAYTDAGTLRDVRSKVEKIGLKTYTQVIETEAGRRTRVRVGPFDTRQEADATSAKLKAAGLPGHVLGL